MRWFYLVCLCGIALMGSTRTAAQIDGENVALGGCEPLPRAQNDDIVTLQDKRRAFYEISRDPDERFGSYMYDLDTRSTLDGRIPAVLLESISGQESELNQYNAQGVTLTNDNGDSCDYGIMQINDGTIPVTQSPSYRSDTTANIAAGAQILAANWNATLPGIPLPATNDYDPDWLINWYYPIAAYNSGPSDNWPNNPGCTSRYDFCGNNPYNVRRPSYLDQPFDVLQTLAFNPGQFPYQEIILYNLIESTRPEEGLWRVQGLDLPVFIREHWTGILPNDSLFLQFNDQGMPRSYAPNLLLFSHTAYVHTPTGKDVTFWYDLPLPARVTLSIHRPDDSRKAMVFNDDSPAGISSHRWSARSSQQALEPGDYYRLEATARSSRGGQFEGLYTEYLIIPVDTGEYFVYLPYLGSSRNLVRNGNLLQKAAPLEQADREVAEKQGSDSSYMPAYWDLQSIINDDYSRSFMPAEVVTTRRGIQVLQTTKYEPFDQTELRQRIIVPAPGIAQLSYRLTFYMRSSLADNSDSRITVRYREIEGSQWHELAVYGETSENVKQLALPDLQGKTIVPSFLMEFDGSISGERVNIGDIKLVENTTCIPGQPCR